MIVGSFSIFWEGKKVRLAFLKLGVMFYYIIIFVGFVVRISIIVFFG